MFSLSELIFLGLIVLIFIGPKQLPEVARQIARFINEMRRASESFTSQFKESKNQISKELKIDEIKKAASLADLKEPKHLKDQLEFPKIFESDKSEEQKK